MSNVEVQFFLQVKPERGILNSVLGAKAVKITQARPEKVVGDARVYKVTFSLPKSEFEPQEIVAEVTSYETGKPIVHIEDVPTP